MGGRWEMLMYCCPYVSPSVCNRVVRIGSTGLFCLRSLYCFCQRQWDARSMRQTQWCQRKLKGSAQSGLFCVKECWGLNASYNASICPVLLIPRFIKQANEMTCCALFLSMVSCIRMCSSLLQASMVDAWLCGKSSLNPALALLSLGLLCAVSRFELIKVELHYSPDSHQLLWGLAGRTRIVDLLFWNAQGILLMCLTFRCESQRSWKTVCITCVFDVLWKEQCDLVFNWYCAHYNLYICPFNTLAQLLLTNLL